MGNMKFHHFLPQWKNVLATLVKSTIDPSEKNPYDAHVLMLV